MKQLLTIFMVITAMGCNSHKMKTGTVELVTFQTKSGYSDDQVTEAAAKINERLHDFDGFISRHLLKAEDGTWADIVYWKDLESAQSASESIMKEEVAQDFFMMIDESSMVFKHLDPKLVY